MIAVVLIFSTLMRHSDNGHGAILVLGTLQVAQSCKMLEMHADIKPAAGTADAYDFAIVGADEAIAALRCAALTVIGHECQASFYLLGLRGTDIQVIQCCPAFLCNVALRAGADVQPLTQLMMLSRGGWKGKPVVVLGRKEDVPMGLLPLVSIVARPVKHARLVTALLKATALMRSKAQVSAD